MFTSLIASILSIVMLFSCIGFLGGGNSADNADKRNSSSIIEEEEGYICCPPLKPTIGTSATYVDGVYTEYDANGNVVLIKIWDNEIVVRIDKNGKYCEIDIDTGEVLYHNNISQVEEFKGSLYKDDYGNIYHKSSDGAHDQLIWQC